MLENTTSLQLFRHEKGQKPFKFLADFEFVTATITWIPISSPMGTNNHNKKHP